MAQLPSAPLGGSGASSKKLVGCENFVRHNPRSDRFPMHDFDHIEIWCSDATSTARRFSAAFGLTMVAASDIDNGSHKYTSYVLSSDSIRFVFTAPYWTEAPDSKITRAEAFPNFDRDAVNAFVVKHGLAVRAIGIQVDDATDAYEKCVANGGVGMCKPVTIEDANGKITYSEVAYYGDVVFRYIEGRKTFKGSFLPGYAEKQRKDVSFGLTRIDHVVTNAPSLCEITDHAMKFTGFHEFGEFVAADVGTVDSGLNSMILSNNENTILLPVNEPTFGTRRKSQIQSFIEHHQGAGVQHIAIMTDDILATVKKMSEASDFGGVDFMPAPGDSYYSDHVPKKMGNMVDETLIRNCQRYGILIDRDEEGGLLQIFTKPLLDRPTLFVEIIQRLGCKQPDGRQKPACGGFGKGNFGALFKSIEDWEKMRDGEM